MRGVAGAPIYLPSNEKSTTAIAPSESASHAVVPVTRATCLYPTRPSGSSPIETAESSLWAEVLNLDGYDVLAKPFNADEIRHVLENGLSGKAQPESWTAGRHRETAHGGRRLGGRRISGVQHG